MEPNTTVNLRQSSLLPGGASGQGPDIQQPSGAIPQAFEAFGPAADGLRKPVNLTLFDPGGLGGILIGAGAAINADPRASGPASISLTGAMVTVLGSITAPSGSISLLSGGGPVIDIGPVSNPPPATAQDVWIGSNAVLDVSAMFIPNPRIAAYATGSLLDAGTITLDGPTVVTQPGSQLLLRGGVATIDVAGGGGAPGASRFASETIWSNGGTLQLAGIGIGNLYFAGAVDAAGGAPLAAGGSLIIGNAADFSGASEPSILIIEPGGVVAANLPATAAYPLTPADLAAVTPANAGAFIGVDTLSHSGFNSLSLAAGVIGFNGSVTVSVPGALTLYSLGGHFFLLPQTATLLPPGVGGAYNGNNVLSYSPPPASGTNLPSIGGATGESRRRLCPPRRARGPRRERQRVSDPRRRRPERDGEMDRPRAEHLGG